MKHPPGNLLPYGFLKICHGKTATNLCKIGNLDSNILLLLRYRIYTEESSQLNEEISAINVPLPSTPHETDATIVARDSVTNTETTTGLSLVATVTEHTDLRDIRNTNLCNKEKIVESDSEGSSEEGHHYSIIVSPSKRDGKLESNTCKGTESDGDIAEMSLANQITREDIRLGTSTLGVDDKNVKHESVTAFSDESKRDLISARPSSSGVKRQKGVTEGIVYIDQEGYETLKALAPFPPKSSDDHRKLKRTHEITGKPKSESSQSVSIETSSLQLSSGTDEPKYVCDEDIDIQWRKMEITVNKSPSKNSCDKMVNWQNVADESRVDQGKKISETNVRKRRREQIKNGQILPHSFIMARQISQEVKKAKYDISPAEENKDISEVSIQEIDKDIEQYFRSEDEINLLKKLHATKC